MSSTDITERNRKNAGKSTGPKTAAGKAVVSQNARKHGVTGKPDPEQLKTWLAIILGRTDISAQDLMPDTELGLRALRLAETEVRLRAVLEAITALKEEWEDEFVPISSGDLLKEANAVIDLAKEMLEFSTSSPKGFRLNITIDNGHYGPFVRGYPLVVKRAQVLQRYLGEARAQRRRAFEAWVKARSLRSASKPLNPETKPAPPARSTPHTAN